MDDWTALQRATAACRQERAVLVIDHAYPLTRSLEALELLKTSDIYIRALDLPELSEQHLDLLISLLNLQRETRSHRAKKSLKAAKARGVVLGNPHLSEMHKQGELSHTPEAIKKAQKQNRRLADKFANELRPVVEELVQSNQIKTVRELADALNSSGVPSRRGRKWSVSAAHRLLKRIGVPLVSDKQVDPNELPEEWGKYA